ncbi:MAG: nucleotidyltransferase [Gammaproteobacteria bacterium]|nr:nucleotidyltransferase [Gammaproteobacteria bacterium]
MPEHVPEAFLKVLADLTSWLESANAPAMVVGGIAASILGRPRATRDIDCLAFMPEERWSAFLAEAQTHGIGPRIEQPLDFARRTRVLLLRHAGSGIDIDVILGRLPYEEEAISRGEFHDLAGVRVKLPQVEDLIIMKAIARRPQDLRDIEGLLDAHPEANINRVRQWVREFSVAMAMPDILDSLERLLAQRNPRSD